MPQDRALHPVRLTTLLGRGYLKLTKPLPYRADYDNVDLATAPVSRLVGPALAGNAENVTWSHSELDWSA